MAERVVGHGSFGVVFQVSLFVVYYLFAGFELSRFDVFCVLILIRSAGEVLGDWGNCGHKEGSSRQEI